MPRRATTLRSGGRFSTRGFLAFSGLIALLVVGVGWLAGGPVASCTEVASGLVGALSIAASAPQPATTENQNLQQLAEAPPPAPDATAVSGTMAPGSQVAPTTLRHWDAAAPGIMIDPVLTSLLDRALIGVDGDVGVAVKDLGSGRGAVLDGGLELQSASLYKLPVLYTVFAVGLNMNEELPITDEALSYDAGTMELGASETLSVAEALERMVTLSDNTSAIMLGSRVGANHINASIAALRMDSTHYSLERMTTSALDMLHLVEVVADGKAVSPVASADMLHLMLRQRVNDRLPRLLPGDVQVAHKTGNLSGVVNDVGILYGPTSTIAIAALVSDTSDETTAATGIAQVALAAYAYFANQPEETNRPLIPPAPSRPIPPVWREPHPVVLATATPTEAPVVPTEVRAAATQQSTAAPAAATTATPAPPVPPVAPTAVATIPPTAAPLVATPVPTSKPTPPPPAPTATPVPPAATATPPPAPTKAPTRAAAPTPAGPGKR